MSDPESPSLRIVIPAYNEETRIGPTLEDYCANFGETAHVVVVANACSDRTGDVVRALQERFDNLSIIEIPTDIGKGGAVRAGLSTGNEPFVGFIDADGATSATEFRRLFRAIAESDVDAIIASRWLPESKVQPRQKLARRVASRLFNAIVRILFGLPIADTQCGAKLFRRESLRTIMPSLEVNGFAFDIELLWLLRKGGFSIAECATVWSDKAPSSKIRLLRDGSQMIVSALRLRMRHSSVSRSPVSPGSSRRAPIV